MVVVRRRVLLTAESSGREMIQWIAGIDSESAWLFMLPIYQSVNRKSVLRSPSKAQ
jgi:hypothetical protein